MCGGSILSTVSCLWNYKQQQPSSVCSHHLDTRINVFDQEISCPASITSPATRLLYLSGWQSLSGTQAQTLQAPVSLWVDLVALQCIACICSLNTWHMTAMLPPNVVSCIAVAHRQLQIALIICHGHMRTCVASFFLFVQDIEFSHVS